MNQKIINTLYRHPRAELKRIRKFGGYFAYRKMLYNGGLMEKVSALLPPVQSHSDGLNLYFLTGKKYLNQTLFCIWSLKKYCGENFNFILVDDGTFTDRLITQIHRQLPGSQIITGHDIEQTLTIKLPIEKFPNLWRKRVEYPHIKKLTDIHTLSCSRWKLVLDSDMLFWKDPAGLITWLKNPIKPLHLVDCEESYGYTRDLLESLTGSSIPRLLNVGVIGMDSLSINWEKLEIWIDVLEKKEGKSYYLEQALTAMLIGNIDCAVLDAAEYLVNPPDQNISAGVGTLHHYVDTSKKGYYNFAWKKFI